jgi:hypothetical protein
MLKALLLGTLTAGLLAACAATPPAPEKVVGDRTAATAPRFDCLTTGTRIALKDGECANVAGRVYTQDDLQRTGAINPAEALRMLDPSFSR